MLIKFCTNVYEMAHSDKKFEKLNIERMKNSEKIFYSNLEFRKKV